MLRWDIFCRVVDNYGDIGTCWRLARQLAYEHHFEVRLWVDNLESFAHLCPSIAPEADQQHLDSIEVRHWNSDFPAVDVADVVIEAFACEIPANYLSTMASRNVAPVWMNLEYLSAESWVEDCHLLTSPQSRSSLTKYFFFPGFTSKTAGLLRERELLDVREAFDGTAVKEFWRELEINCATVNRDATNLSRAEEFGQNDGALRISLFCYHNSALPDLLQLCSEGGTAVHLLTAPGAPTDQVAEWFGEPFSAGQKLRKRALTVTALPFLSPTDYDKLLWACDVNFVRGEESFIRAQWAQRPFVWQIYPQTEHTHITKLDAFLDRYLANCGHSSVVRRCFHAWNGTDILLETWPDFLAVRQLIQRHGKVWVGELDRAGNLADNLVSFVCGIITPRDPD